jgi:hypothetical protein
MEKIYYNYQVLLKLLFINDIFSFIFTVIYPHTLPDYKPVMADYEQIDFSNGVDYVKSLGFVITDPNNREFLHKICACKTVFSAISLQSVLLVEETRVPRENHRPVASY